MLIGEQYRLVPNCDRVANPYSNIPVFALKFIAPHGPDWYKHSELRVLQDFQSLTTQCHVVKYFGAFSVPIERTNWTVIVMEYCSGSLVNFLGSDLFRNLQPEEQRIAAWDVVAQIAAGLQSCHSLNPPVIHRDIKLDNGAIPFDSTTDKVVLYTQIKFADGQYDYIFKLGDWGLARPVSPGQELTPIPYSPNFQDPRLSTDVYDHGVDWYSLGFLMMTFTAKMTCTPDPDFTTLYQRLLHQDSKPPYDYVLALAWNKIGQLSQMDASPVRRTIATMMNRTEESNIV